MSSIYRTIVEAEAKMLEDLLEEADDGNIEAFERMEGDSSFDINLANEDGDIHL